MALDWLKFGEILIRDCWASENTDELSPGILGREFHELPGWKVELGYIQGRMKGSTEWWIPVVLLKKVNFQKETKQIF